MPACHREAQQPAVDAPVIVISIDTLRADHLPAYGYRAVETPNIDRFRRDAILFRSAYSHVPLTLPSHISMLTGELPPEHGVRNNIGYAFDATQHPTIASLLHQRGYATGAAVSAYVLRGGTGLRNAFDFYDDAIEARPDAAQAEVQRPGDVTEGIAERWIAQQGARPFFFLLHLYEPHAPYTPPEPFRSRFASAYDGEIATADAITGKFLEFLRRSGIYDRALIVVVSDHGEGLNEHGEAEHGIFLYREDLHVPLLLKLPSNQRAGETIEKPAALIDLFPTIASMTETTSPQRRGHSLLFVDQQPARSIYAETLYPRIHLGWSELRSLIDDRFHFISAPSPELYDVSADPGERANVLQSQRRVYARMRSELDAYGTAIQGPSKNIDPEEAKKLAALGYLTASSATPTGPLPDPKSEIGELSNLARAASLARSGQVEQSVAAYRAVLAHNPRLTEAWNGLGDTLERAGRYEDAVAAYSSAIRTTPELAPELALRVGTLLMRLGNFDEAQQHAAIAEKTNFASAKLLEARIALARNDGAAAMREAQLARNDASTELAAIVLEAQVAARANRPQDALARVAEVDRLRADRHVTNVEQLELVRGEALGRLNRADEAAAAFQREIAAYPEDKQAYAELAILHVVRGDRAGAREVLEQMVHANPNRPAYLLAAKTAALVGDNAFADDLRRRAR
jgi:choline-sulfatase